VHLRLLTRAPGLRTPGVTALGAAFLAAVALAADERPRLALDEGVHDFGAVERGTTVSHTFVLHNGGGLPLRIEHVKSSCGCTVGVASERDVPPAGEGRVAVTLDTARLSGRTTKIATVYTNDPDTPAASLVLTGQVLTDLVVTPSPLYLGRVRRGQHVEREVLVAPGRAGADYAVTAVEPSTLAVQARLEPRSDGPGQRVVVVLDADMPLGRLNEQLTLRTSSAREPVLTVPVMGSVEGDVVVLPPQVTFGTARSGTEREVFIRNRGTRPLAVTGVRVPEGVTYRLSTVERGVEYRLSLALEPGLPAGKIARTVEIFTDHPDEGHLVVLLYAIVHDGRRRG